MITFVVSRNGRKLCTAAVPGDCFLSAHISSNPRNNDGEQLELSVSGLEGTSQTTFSDWCRETLAIGDEIVIRITECDRPDEPFEVHTDPAEEILLEGKKMTARKLCEQLGWKIIETTD